MSIIRNVFITFHKRRLFLIPPSVALLIIGIAFFKREIVIVPDKNNFSIKSFNDSLDQGHSTADAFSMDSTKITFQYTLRSGYLYPYVGIKIDFLRDSSFLDLSDYDYLSIKIRGTEPQGLIFHLRTFVNGFTRTELLKTHRFLVQDIHCTTEKELLLFPLKSFTTPSWWYYNNNFEDRHFGKEQFHHVMHLIIQNGSTTPLNKSLGYEISSLAFKKDMVRRVLFWGSLIALYAGIYLLISLYLKRFSKKSAPRVVVSYEPLDIENYADEEVKRIAKYVSVHYAEPELNVNQVSLAVGIFPSKIPTLLQRTFNCNFKQYLNAIRLAEAKRLIKETDRTIAYISRKVGYNNVTHFNRIFKQAEDISPNQFRKAHLPGN